MKFFDLFAGVGGFRLGMERAGHECVGSCEWNKYSRETYKKNFGDYPKYNDARELDPKGLPDFDVLCAGFPCQAFSIAGKRMGFEDTRGTVFFEIARIAKEKRPRYLFLENVKGLLNHERGQTFRAILETLDELGYDAEWQLFNSKYFVPQNRERVFIIGHLRGERTRQVFPIRESNTITNREEQNKGEVSTPRSYCTTIDANYHKGPDGKRTLVKELDQIGFIHKNVQGQRVYNPDNISCTLTSESGGWGGKTGLYAINDPKIKSLGQITDHNATIVYDTDGIAPTLKASSGSGNYTKIACKPVLTPERLEKRQNGRRFKEDGEPSFTLTATDKHGVMLEKNFGIDDNGRTISNTIRTGGRGSLDRHSWDIVKTNTRIRKLTPVECERLQGFPDGWTEGVSDTQRYKQMGNAVTVDVVHFIASNF